MKAGILTFHEADNYGAVLQAWALQRTLKKLGAESEFITVKTATASEAQPSVSGPAAVFAKRLKAESAKRVELFSRFRENHMICSPSYTKEELQSIDKDYDLFIAGSDQIWNFRIPGADEKYFLPFAASKKRFSYAASFGAEELPEVAKPWCARQLNSFAAISVREESGRSIVRELTGRDAAVSLDPTLLLSPSDWEELIQPADRGSYIFLFMLKYDESLAFQATQAAKDSGLELKVVTAAFMPQCGLSAWNTVGVEDWVGLIAGASRVFTNSFHGTALSLLFERPLSVARLKGKLSKRNGRIEELLKHAGLESAFSGELCFLDPGVFGERIGKARDKSIQYLKEILNYAGTV